MEDVPDIENEHPWPYLCKLFEVVERKNDMFGMVNGRKTSLVNINECVFASFASCKAVIQWRVFSSNTKLLK